MADSIAEELKHIIMQHVAEQHRDRALMLLKAIQQRRYHCFLEPGAPCRGVPGRTSLSRFASLVRVLRC